MITLSAPHGTSPKVSLYLFRELRKIRRPLSLAQEICLITQTGKVALDILQERIQLASHDSCS